MYQMHLIVKQIDDCRGYKIGTTWIVYDIIYPTFGRPQFLLYDERTDKWFRSNSKHYAPHIVD